MERLTRRLNSGAAVLTKAAGVDDPVEMSAIRQNAFNRLAAYEDTGLEPDEAEQNTILLFMVVRMQVMQKGLELGKTEEEIDQMSIDTIEEMRKMADFKKAKEIYLAAREKKQQT